MKKELFTTIISAGRLTFWSTMCAISISSLPTVLNGPIIIDCKEGEAKNLVASFDAAFSQYCTDHHIIAEYIRFSPWLKNHEDFSSIYDLRYNNETFGVDLIHGDFFTEEFASKCRRAVRKAQKSGVSHRI